jgi:hypothetical protein
MKARLQSISAELEQIQTKAKEMQVDASVKVDNSLEPLRAKLADIRDNVAELAESSDRAWDWGNLKSGIEISRSGGGRNLPESKRTFWEVCLCSNRTDQH